jgi:hypothetical protein
MACRKKLLLLRPHRALAMRSMPSAYLRSARGVGRLLLARWLKEQVRRPEGK